MAQGMHGSIGVKGEFVAAVFEAFDFGHRCWVLMGEHVRSGDYLSFYIYLLFSKDFIWVMAILFNCVKT
jgi:hypothetical protein